MSRTALRAYCQSLRRAIRRLVCKHEGAEHRIEGTGLNLLHVTLRCPRCSAVIRFKDVREIRKK